MTGIGLSVGQPYGESEEISYLIHFMFWLDDDELILVRFDVSPDPSSLSLASV